MTNAGDLGEWSFQVEAGKIAEFARAVGGASRDVAPPTFTVAASAHLMERLVSEVFRLDRSRTVHGEQSYDFLAPIRAGMTLTCTARLLSDETKPGRMGGLMRVISVCVTYADAATGEQLVRETSVILEKATGG